ncbi:protein of unknown function DUF221 [Cynara cardunculus var. scolymus]|uniref:Uncharacterized protein n=1 Tax=Cynara cardunculus var. scolymus TaxID=59895 RepID=A0A103XEP3_CYNCS|nr:protein of unknown function DUF221 [Cynara cardunculus var. scolymus]
MDFSSFLTSLSTSFIIFVILMILFAWLSTKPGNAVVYYPNRILKGMDPWEGSRSKTRNPFAWIREALSSSEQDVIAMSGVDSAVFFVFLSTVFGIFVLSGIVLLPLLLPIAITERNAGIVDSTGKNAFDDLDKLSMAHLNNRSARLWAFMASCYWVSFVSYFLLWRAYKHVSDLRATALKSPEVKPEQFAILVRDIPYSSEGYSRNEQVDTYFKSMYPETYYKSMVVTDNKEVNKIYEELEACKKKVRRAESIYSDSKKEPNPQGVRPTHRLGFLGLLGKEVDTIDYCNEKIHELTPKLEAAQKETLREKQLASALVFFNNRTTAAAAGQCVHSQIVDTWTVMNAPESRQLLWTNLSKTYYAREIRQYVVYLIVFLTICFYMIPIGLISALTTLANLKKLAPFLKPVVDQAEIRTVLEAYLPQIALIVFLALLPKFLLFLSKAEGIPSESHAVRAASGKYFYFSVLNVKYAICRLIYTVSNLRFFVGYGLELSRIVPLIIFHLKRKYLCKTEADLKEAWLPAELGYATKVPTDLLILTIVICYSVIAPLIIPFGAIYFGLGWLVFRNQILKVYVPKYESYGKMWPHLHVRILGALILFQITMVGYFSIKEFIYSPLIIPLPIFSLLFAFVCSKKFYGFFQTTGIEVASHDLKETPNMDLIFKSFIPPSLNPDKLDDERLDDGGASYDLRPGLDAYAQTQDV